MKVLALAVLVFCAGQGDGANPFLGKLVDKNGRQKRLLFYDEQGNLVKTYANPFIQNFGQTDEKNPFFWNFLNPFFSFLRPSTFGGSTIAYMIPVSEAVVQQINTDPIYQNKLMILSTRDPLVEANPLCAGKRVPIPSPNLCSNFLNCWDGWAFEQECPAGLLFSSEGYCDYAHHVDCSNRKLKEIPKPLCSKDFEAFRNEADCNEFFVCVHSVPVRFKCPADLAYSQVLGVCDYPTRVDCNGTKLVIPPSTATPIQLDDVSLLTSSTASTVLSSKPSSAAPSENVVVRNVEYNSQSWSSTHVAMSRQDAVRQLQLGAIANINTP